MTLRVLLVAAVIALGCSVLSAAKDVSVGTHGQSSLTTYKSANLATLKSLTRPRTNIKKVGDYCDGDDVVCAPRGCGCGPGYETDCCNNCYIQEGHVYGECE